MRRNNLAHRFLVFFLTGLLSFTFIYDTRSFAKTRLPKDCEKELVIAEWNYREGSFDEAIQILLRLRYKKGCREQEKALAYKLLAKIYIAKNYLAQARLAIRKMLELDGNIVLDPGKEPPPFIYLFKEAKKVLEEEKSVVATGKPQKKKSNFKLWPWLVGTGVAGAAAFIVFGGGEADDSFGSSGFPRPVGRPDNDN